MPTKIPAETDQAAIVRAFESGAATCDERPLKRIDTHMSHLFLGPTRVYKLKRSHRHPFADMSSVAARRGACEAEIAVNRLLAPSLYEAVSPVVRNNEGAFHLGGPGEVVDWVVAMRRFPDGALFEELAAVGQLTPVLAERAAAAVAEFHAQQPARGDAGHTADYTKIIDGLRKTEAEGAETAGVKPASEPLFSALERELTRVSPLIEARRKAGWVRRGHGDLHLRNICLFEGRVTPFDALEFDPALATSDVLYDTAFLLMDLRGRGLHGLANVALNQYWDVSGQPEGAAALLPLFMALRSTVRMAVSVEGGDFSEAARYRSLGLELLERPPPRLVAIGGLSGTGKSTLAKDLAPDLPGPCGARLLRSDMIRKTLAGIDTTARAPDAAYGPKQRAQVYHQLATRAAEALNAGSSVVADATFREDQARAEIEGAAGSHNFVGLWLKTTTEVRLDRVANRRDDASDATSVVARAQTEPQQLGVEWRIIEADCSVETLAAAARASLRR